MDHAYNTTAAYQWVHHSQSSTSSSASSTSDRKGQPDIKTLQNIYTAMVNGENRVARYVSNYGREPY